LTDLCFVCCSNEGDSVALHCIGRCCLLVSVFVLTSCTSRVFSVVDLPLFLFWVCLNDGGLWTAGNARWNVAGRE